MSEENYETYCEYICVESNPIASWVEGQIYYFHEDTPLSAFYFLPVVDEQGFPVTKRVRTNG